MKGSTWLSLSIIFAWIGATLLLWRLGGWPCLMVWFGYAGVVAALDAGRKSLAAGEYRS